MDPDILEHRTGTEQANASEIAFAPPSITEVKMSNRHRAIIRMAFHLGSSSNQKYLGFSSDSAFALFSNPSPSAWPICVTRIREPAGRSLEASAVLNGSFTSRKWPRTQISKTPLRGVNRPGGQVKDW